MGLAILKPFMLSRLKEDTDLKLPNKIETHIYCPPSEIQKELQRNLVLLRKVNPKQVGQAGNILMLLRELASHPYIIPGVEEGDDEFPEHLVTNCGKMKILDKLVKKLRNEGHRILIFSQFKTMLDILADYCTMRGYTFFRLDGDTNI